MHLGAASALPWGGSCQSLIIEGWMVLAVFRRNHHAAARSGM
jgi:hypothetical protein